MRFRKDCNGSVNPSNQQEPTPTSNQPHKMPPNPNEPTHPTPNTNSGNRPIHMRPNSKPSTKTTTTPRPITITATRRPSQSTRTPKPIQIDNGFICQDSKDVSSQNGQQIKRDFDYFALSMNWPETSCRFLMTKGKTCNIPG